MAYSPEELKEQYRTLEHNQKERISELVRKEYERATRHKSGGPNKTHCAKGRLIFQPEMNGGQKIPLHHMHVELWDRDIGNPDDYLGSTITDYDGTFEIAYDPDDAGSFDSPDLELRVFEEQHRYDNAGYVRNKKKLIFKLDGCDDVRQEEYDFGDCEIPYWEYDPEQSIPRLFVTEQGRPPQAYETGRNLAMIKIAPFEGLKRKHRVQPIAPTITSVQQDYNLLKVSKTVQLEQENKGFTRSDEYFGRILLNGMAASVLDKNPKNPDEFWIHYHWSSYESDGEYAMPNVDVFLKQFPENDQQGPSNEDKGILKPVSITVNVKAAGETRPDAPMETITATPEDGEKWQQAKRIARVCSSLQAELDSHLCATHLNGEQYAIAAYRNIRKNPIRYLLFPHIKEVCLVNKQADSFLLSEEGFITKATGFTKESIYEHIEQVMGTLDWKNWEPRKAVSPRHLYARATRLYWDILGEFIDWFVEENKEEITKHWLEIKRFSDDLVKHSAKEFLCTALQRMFGAKSKKDIPWMDWNERMDIDVPREHNGKYNVAVSAITRSKHDPTDEDFENLKQVCRYVIHHTTFVHSWSNSQQYDEGGELRFTSLGLRYGDHGIFTDESDDSVLPPPREATKQLLISYFLSSCTYGFILNNEERDIHPEFVRLLKKYKEKFTDIHPGLDVSKIPSRTNI